MKIVSLLPSATEMIVDLGLTDELVGISHACDWPSDVMHLPRVTSCIVPKNATSLEIDTVVRAELEQSSALYAIDTEQLKEIAPDLIMTQALCDVCAVNGADVEQAICSLPTPARIVNLEPFTLMEVLDTLTALGEATNTVEKAKAIRADCESRIEAVHKRTQETDLHKPKTIVLDWVDPPFVSGHWMHDLITLAGGTDSMGTPKTPSWTASWDKIHALGPENLFIACCGFDVDRSLVEIEQSDASTELDILKKAGCKIHIVDGNALYSRPSLRLVDSLELMAHLLHPSVHTHYHVRGVDKPVLWEHPWS